MLPAKEDDTGCGISIWSPGFVPRCDENFLNVDGGVMTFITSSMIWFDDTFEQVILRVIGDTTRNCSGSSFLDLLIEEAIVDATAVRDAYGSTFVPRE